MNIQEGAGKGVRSKPWRLRRMSNSSTIRSTYAVHLIRICKILENRKNTLLVNSSNVRGILTKVKFLSAQCMSYQISVPFESSTFKIMPKFGDEGLGFYDIIEKKLSKLSTHFVRNFPYSLGSQLNHLVLCQKWKNVNYLFF